MNFCFPLHHHISILECLDVCVLPLHCLKIDPSLILEHTDAFLLDHPGMKGYKVYDLETHSIFIPEMSNFRNLFVLLNKAMNRTRSIAIIMPFYHCQFLILWILLLPLTFMQLSCHIIPPLIMECSFHMLVLLLELPLEIKTPSIFARLSLSLN